MLQLGHAGEGVEIGQIHGLLKQNNTSLQLGHAGEGVEIRQAFTAFATATGFNWATPVKAWRSPASHHASTSSPSLQLGHAGEGVEIRSSVGHGWIG